MFTTKTYHKLKTDQFRSNIRKATRSRSNASRLPTVPEQPKSNLTMKVKELRNWLSDLSDKNKEHYRRFNGELKTPSPKNESDDVLGIQSKPSMTSSCPSTAILDGEDPFFAASFSSDDDEDYNHDFNVSDEQKIASRTLQKKGVERVTSKEHLALLLKQAPRTQEEDGYSTSQEDSRDDDHSVLSMHKSPLVRDQLLTKAVLDALSESKKAPKSLGEKLERLKVSDHQGNFDLDSSKESQNSSNAPSIAQGVLVSKIANVFLNEYSEPKDGELNDPPPPPPSERRRFIDPKDLSFLKSSFTGAPKREDLDYAKPPKTPTTTVGKGIRKFGGPPKTLVERRTEKLLKKFEQEKKPVYVSNRTWGVATSHGKYEKRYFLDRVYK